MGKSFRTLTQIQMHSDQRPFFHSNFLPTMRPPSFIATQVHHGVRRKSPTPHGRPSPPCRWLSLAAGTRMRCTPPRHCCSSGDALLPIRPRASVLSLVLLGCNVLCAVEYHVPRPHSSPATRPTRSFIHRPGPPRASSHHSTRTRCRQASSTAVRKSDPWSGHPPQRRGSQSQEQRWTSAAPSFFKRKATVQGCYQNRG